MNKYERQSRFPADPPILADEIEAELPRHHAWRGHVSQVQWLDHADSTHNASTNLA